MKVLLVDDHEDSLFALESALSRLGYPLERATSGDAALRTVLRGDVALVVLDVLMPGTDGLDVARYLNRLDQTRDIPVILITGSYAGNALAEQALALGVADLLVKPVDPWALCIKVQYLYESRRPPYHVPLQPTTRQAPQSPAPACRQRGGHTRSGC